MSQKDEIKACLVANLERELDRFMVDRDFARARNSLIYGRSFSGSSQKIDINLGVHPKERPDASAVIYPLFEVAIPEVDAIVDEMIEGNLGLLEGVTGARSRQPIEITSRKVANARWYIFQPDSVPGVVDELKRFLERWTVPLLDVYATASDIVAADDRKDGRILKDRAQMLRVIAAALVHEGPKAAQIRMEKSFGSIGLRRRYKSIFDYLAARAIRH